MTRAPARDGAAVRLPAWTLLLAASAAGCATAARPTRLAAPEPAPVADRGVVSAQAVAPVADVAAPPSSVETTPSAPQLAAGVPAADALAVDAPTWTALYRQYFAAGTEGGCGRARACHAAEMANADSAYTWLEQRGYIDGPRSPIASASNSCLHWFGGNMPPGAGENPRAVRDLMAWVAAGARND